MYEKQTTKTHPFKTHINYIFFLLDHSYLVRGLNIQLTNTKYTVKIEIIRQSNI